MALAQNVRNFVKYNYEFNSVIFAQVNIEVTRSPKVKFSTKKKKQQDITSEYHNYIWSYYS